MKIYSIRIIITRKVVIIQVNYFKMTNTYNKDIKIDYFLRTLQNEKKGEVYNGIKGNKKISTRIQTGTL